MFILKTIRDINYLYQKQQDQAKINQLSRLIDQIDAELNQHQERLNFLAERRAKLAILNQRSVFTSEDLHDKKQLEVDIDYVENHPLHVQLKDQYADAQARLANLKLKLQRMQQAFSTRYESNDNNYDFGDRNRDREFTL